LVEDYIFRLTPGSEFLNALLCEFQIFRSLDPNESGGILFQNIVRRKCHGPSSLVGLPDSGYKEQNSFREQVIPPICAWGLLQFRATKAFTEGKNPRKYRRRRMATTQVACGEFTKSGIQAVAVSLWHALNFGS
jgi:hypothetical protein